MIEVNNLTIDFGVTRILNNLSFKVNNGDRIAIIGPSGEGKSVMLKAILGLLKPNAGTILIDDINIYTASHQELLHLRQKIGVLFQGSALFDFMTLEQNVGFPLRVHEDFDEETMLKMVNESLALVGLEDSNDKMPDELSGGMQKRAALARAIVRKPKFMFYDEPVSGLDPIRSRVINELIGMLNSKFNLTSITVTHDMNSLSSIADKVLFLYKSEILFYDYVYKVHENKILSDFIRGTGYLK